MEMKKTVQMLATQRGSQDGFTVETFQKDEKYTISESLAKVFVQMGAAVYASEVLQAPKPPGLQNLQAPETKKNEIKAEDVEIDTAKIRAETSNNVSNTDNSKKPFKYRGNFK